MAQKYKQKTLIRMAIFATSFLMLPAFAGACNIFNWSDCDNAGTVTYCNSNDPTSSKYCSIDRGTQVVAKNVNDIQTAKKFSQYIQDIVAYLLLFLGIVGVLYIIYAGFNIIIAGGDEEKVKQGKKTIMHVLIGVLLIFLAYSIVKFVIGKNGQGGVLNNAFVLPSLVETTYAYTDYDTNTFDAYKKKIEFLSANLDQEYQVNNKISTKTLTELSTLVTQSMETFPDSENIIFNTNLTRSLLTSIELVKKNQDSDTYVTSLAKTLNEYMTKIKIERIKGAITASPDSGNAPLTTTLRAQNIVDPSGVTTPRGNYIWWIRAAGGGRTIIGTGPSLAYTFQEERNYTVFLTIISASRNAKGRTDVLPFESSININALPKLGNVRFYINGVYVSNLDRIKVTPDQGRAGIILDASASTPAAGTTFVQSTWDFGNGNTARYSNGPGIERQIYAREGTYRVKLDIATNEGKTLTKFLDIEIRNPAASIKTDRTTGFPNEEFHFSAASNFSSSIESSYEWKIYDTNNETVLYTSNHKSIAYKFTSRGDHMVRLRSIAPNGSEDIDTVIIAIEQRDPVAFFDTKIASSELPNTILFDATRSYNPDSFDTANLTFNWTIDGDKVSLANPSRNGGIGKYTFDTIGTHNVLLEVINQEGKATTYKRDLSIDSLLSIKLVVSPKIAVAGNPVTLIADAREARAFEWQFGDGETDTSTSGRITHVYKKAGTFDVNLTIRGTDSKLSNSISRKVYVMNSDSPFAMISFKRWGDEIIETPDACDGHSAFVTDRSQAMTIGAENSINVDGNNAGLSYTWKYGNNKTSSQREFSYKFDELGCFPVTLTVRSQKTGKMDTTKAYVSVQNLLPKLSSLSVTPDKLESDPVTVTVTANNAIDDDGAIVSYTWYYYTEDDPEPQDFRITRTPKTVFVLPRITGKYFFAVILEDSNGAKVNSEDMGQKSPLTLTSDNINTPLITLKSSSTSVTVWQKVDFDVSVKNILGNDISDKTEYKWDFNGDGFYEETTNTPKVGHVYDKPGNFNFKVKATYKGISNTKYQIITVKNDIVPNLEYIAFGKKFVFFNTTKGLYSKVKWTIGNTISTENPTSFSYDFGDEDVSGVVNLEVSDGKDTKNISVDLKKDVLNAMRLKKSEEKLVVFTYPNTEDDTVHIKDPGEKFFIYMGESKGNPTRYTIDTDIKVDSNLNGDPADDIDNKGTDSSVNGSTFVVKGFDLTSQEKTVRLSIYDANNTLIATKDIKMVFDYADASAEALSGSTSELPKDISDKDRADMERLKDLIKSVRDQDRLRMMQFFSALQENWFDTREKTKTIIDFESYVDTSAGVDAKTKETFYSILEGLLLSDTQVKDDVALATKVLKSLIPKTNKSYGEIMKNIDEILSHPTNTTLNKELGKFILDAIKDDTTIENKDKITIKSQLEVIIAGGQQNLVEKQPQPVAETSGFSFLAFVTGFLKVFAFAILAILGLFLAAFVYFKIFNKQEHLGFQDFLIERFTHKKGESHAMQTKTETYAPKPEQDVLANIATRDIPKEEMIETPEIPRESTTEETPVSESFKEESVPDWLRQASVITPVEEAPAEEPMAAPVAEIVPDTIEESVVPEVLSESIPEIPEAIHTEVLEVPETTHQETVVAETPEEELPEWLRSMDQVAIEKEVEQELGETPVAALPEDIKDAPEPTLVAKTADEEIPDWLRSVSNTPVEVTPTEVTPIPALEELVIMESSPSMDAVPTEKKPRSPKKKATPKEDSTPAPDTPIPDNSDLPDWLK